MKRLSKEIAFTLSVKLVLLGVLWYICFAPHKHPKINTERVMNHLLIQPVPQGDTIK